MWHLFLKEEIKQEKGTNLDLILLWFSYFTFDKIFEFVEIHVSFFQQTQINRFLLKSTGLKLEDH